MCNVDREMVEGGEMVRHFHSAKQHVRLLATTVSGVMFPQILHYNMIVQLLVVVKLRLLTSALSKTITRRNAKNTEGPQNDVCDSVNGNSFSGNGVSFTHCLSL